MSFTSFNYWQQGVKLGFLPPRAAEVRASQGFTRNAQPFYIIRAKGFQRAFGVR
jgi:hypothetical protein